MTRFDIKSYLKNGALYNKENKLIKEEYLSTSLTLENLGSGNDVFEDELNDKNVSISGGPEDTSIFVSGGNITFEIDLDVRKFGIAGISVRILEVNLDLIYEDEFTGEEKEKSVKITEPNAEIEINGTQITLNELSIDMNDSEDPSNWTTEAVFGYPDQE